MGFSIFIYSLDIRGRNVYIERSLDGRKSIWKLALNTQKENYHPIAVKNIVFRSEHRTLLIHKYTTITKTHSQIRQHSSHHIHVSTLTRYGQVFVCFFSRYCCVMCIKPMDVRYSILLESNDASCGGKNSIVATDMIINERPVAIVERLSLDIYIYYGLSVRHGANRCDG